jgi:hypothetical protein
MSRNIAPVIYLVFMIAVIVAVDVLSSGIDFGAPIGEYRNRYGLYRLLL